MIVTQRDNRSTAWIIVAVIAIVAIVALGLIYMNTSQQTSARQAQMDAAAQLQAANDATRLSLSGAADAGALAAQAAAERAESAAEATGAALDRAADASAQAARDAAASADAAITIPPGGSVSTATTTETYRVQ